MTRPLIRKVFPQALAWVAAVAFCSVVALAQTAGQNAGQAAGEGPAPGAGQRTDGQIEMDVVHALDASAALKDDLITAATIQGQVTLAGTVSSEASRQLAESIVKGVPGVAGVKDNLKVGNPADDQNAQDMQAANGDNSGPPDTADNAPNDTGQAPAPPDDGQNQAPAYGQNPPPPGYGQNSPAPDNGQGQAPAYGQNPPPPGYGQNPPPGYGQGQYPNQYPGQRSPYRPQYTPQQPQQPSYEFARGPMTVPAGTLIQVRTSEAVGSKRAVEGTPVQFTVIRDVTLGGVLAIPRGATVHGVVTEVRRTESGSLGGSSELALRLTSLDLSGQNYPLESDEFRVRGPNKAGRTVGSAFGGALLGAIIGGAAGGGGGAAIGAAAGAGAGTVVSAATPGPGVWIPAEALVTFHLADAVTVQPVREREADRLSQGLYQGGPSLYQRGPRYYGGYGRPYGYGTPYPYGPVYYRPYYMVGGAYYWR